jgi:ribosomal protein S21
VIPPKSSNVLYGTPRHVLRILTNSNTTHHTCFFAFHPFGLSTAIPASSTALPVKIKVLIGEGEPIESALRRFKREVNKSGHLMELRHKRYFENSQDRKKRKIVQARIRKRLERMQARRLRQQRS